MYLKIHFIRFKMCVYRFFFHKHVREYGLNIVWNGKILILIFVLLHRIMSLELTHKTLIFINVNLYVNFYLVRGKWRLNSV